MPVSAECMHTHAGFCLPRMHVVAGHCLQARLTAGVAMSLLLQLSDFLNWHRKCTERCSAAVPLGQQLAAQFDLNRNVPPRCLLTER